MLVVISDFCAPHWGEELKQLARAYDVIAIQVVDARELKLEPGSKQVVWYNPVTGNDTVLDGSKRQNRENYAKQGVDFLKETREAIVRAGASHLVLETDKVSGDEALVNAIEQFLLTRKRRKGGIYARPA